MVFTSGAMPVMDSMSDTLTPLTLAMARAGLMPHVQRIFWILESMRSISSRPTVYTFSTLPPMLR